jgi:hypothetical protein
MTIQRLLDNDPMPWGKYARTSPATTMQHVPASYLHWLWANGKKDDQQCLVADYIRRNLKYLAEEYPDGIWD